MKSDILTSYLSTVPTILRFEKDERSRKILENLPLVVSIARKYFGQSSMSPDDVVQEGIRGLVRVVDKFDESLGWKFSTIAHRYIEGFILNTMRATKIRELMSAVRPLEEDIVAGKDVSCSEAVDVKDSVEFFMNHLTRRERDLIRRRFGIGLDEPETLEEMAASMGICRERVRQRENAILRKMSMLTIDRPMPPCFRVTDPDRATDYSRSDPQLQEFLLFCVAVAGKAARVIKRLMDDFWIDSMNKVGGWGLPPFAIVRRLRGKVSLMLKRNGVGCHGMKGDAFSSLANSGIDLRECSVGDLEAHPGVGMKTSRFFILHSRPNARVACLDTHVLSFLRSKGVDAPDSTPAADEYLQLEQEFLRFVPKDMTVAEFDLSIWKSRARRAS